MLTKLVFAAVLAVGVLGRTVPEEDSWMSSMVAADFCEQDKMEQVKSSMSTFKQCVTDMMTDYSFQIEVREAMLSKNTSRTVKAFCSKSSEMKTCIRTLFTNMTPCFTANGLRNTQKQVNSAIDFICANDGAKMVLFLKEGGKECMAEKSFVIASCKSDKTSTIARLVEQYGSRPAIPEKERCKIDKQNDACTLAAMKTCSNPMPGKLAEELISAVGINCDNEKQVTESSTAKPTDV